MTRSYVPHSVGRVLLPGFVLIVAIPAHGHVELNAPNGGELLEAGSVFTITWRIAIAHDLQDWDLELSTDGGIGWAPIAMDLPAGSSAVSSDHTYDWTVPNSPSNQVLVRVRMDNSGTDYYDESDAAFTIAGQRDVEDPPGPEVIGPVEVPRSVLCGMGVMFPVILALGTLMILRAIRHRPVG